MENISANTIAIIITSATLVLALIAWLIYRNTKDKEKYEQDMDNPNREVGHKEGEKM